MTSAAATETRTVTVLLPPTMPQPQGTLMLQPVLVVGVTMIKPTTSYFFFFFRHNRICGLAVAFKNNFLGGLPALPKKSQNRGVLGELRQTSRNANNVIRPPPLDPPPRAMILRVFIPLWRIRRCSRTGATLAHATALPDFRLGVIFT